MPKAIRVLFEDDCAIVFDKPSGLLSVPTPKNEANTLIRRVSEEFAAARGQLFLCHRLDRDTSGAILFAKGKINQDFLVEAFRVRQVHKKYVAFVRGKPKPAAGEIRIPIKDFHEEKFASGKKTLPRPALTRYKIVEVHDQFSVVEVEPVTGRTNQIRIHFAKIGHPLLGERLYAFGKDFPVKFRRVALHSRELSWPHPLSRKAVHAVCELAEDMKEFLKEH